MVFALKVFNLITIFPLYIILELNHKTVRPPDNDIDPNRGGKREGINTKVIKKNNEQNIGFLYSEDQGNLLLKIVH
ncbi:MAG: hypothetical protein ABIN89_16490 [Chitinophagaceae bacterium]